MKKDEALFIALAIAIIIFLVVILKKSAVNIAPGVVGKLNDAIAYAEGFYAPGSRPSRDNNPGDIEADLIGAAVSFDGPFPVFATIEDGWANLTAQTTAMLNGTSGIYSPDMTITQVSQSYTTDVPQGAQAAWAAAVASRLGVSVDTKLSDLT